jgi:predicted acylesterase/phospholipase RssA
MIGACSKLPIRFAELVLIAVSLVGLGGCAHRRPEAALNCELPAYKMLPSSLDTQRRAGPPENFSQALRDALQARKTHVGRPARRQVLVLSGGSQHGAFGAGFFRGLPQVPEYDVVTGVSTGALMSTPVFLANQDVPKDRSYLAYFKADPKLGAPRQSNVSDLALAYAISKESDLLHVRPFGLGSAALSGSVATFEPLRRLLDSLISEDTVRAVASEADKKGRKLFVGVTNLDDGYGYAVDLTQLASEAVARGSVPSARPCYIDALLASSSVPPGVGPIALKLRGQGDANLFMDGGARYGVFFDQLGDVVTADEPADLTLVVNGSLYGDSWKDKHGEPVAKWSVVNLGFRAIDLLENQVYRLSVADQEKWATRPGSSLRVAFISDEGLTKMPGEPNAWKFNGQTCADAQESDRAKSSPAEFYPSYMRCLIDYGQARGESDPWNKVIVGEAQP